MNLLHMVTQMYDEAVRMPGTSAAMPVPSDSRQVFNEMLGLAKSQFPDVLAIRSIEPVSLGVRFLELAARLQTLRNALAGLKTRSEQA